MNVYGSDSPGRTGDENGGQTDAKGKMRHPVCDAFWDVAALRGWKGHGEGGQGGKRRHFDGDSKIFPLFFCRPLRPLCAAAVV